MKRGGARSGGEKKEKEDSPLRTSRERVQKIIAAAGLCSRREAEEWIRDGTVTVNGKVVSIGDSATRKDDVRVGGVRVEFPTLRYYALHKPAGYVTTLHDVYGKRTVLELVPSDERIYPIGRLDKDTTGLLLFTNDGEFANRVMHPRYEMEKTYLVTLDRAFVRADSVKLAQGIRLDEGTVYARVRVMSPRRVSVKIHQGYNHVVKRIFGALGYRVSELVRTHIGPLKVDIPLGAFRSLTQKEVATILAVAKPRPRPPQLPRERRHEPRSAERRGEQGYGGMGERAKQTPRLHQTKQGRSAPSRR
jgi:23S rRNA pseudouridine2605 synthase